jgi:DNA-binding NtrC family response regulator
VESELFGHAKGAFTGAVNARRGRRFVAADGGTLFLDEIGEMDLEVQRKLLRVLQDFSVTPVGESRARTVDVRIVAATNQDLDAMSERGAFRLDLLYRLNVVQIHLPPLRERRADIVELFDHHLADAANRLGAPAPTIDGEIRATLASAGWPGNIRQLRNIAERLVILRAGRPVRGQDLPQSIRAAAGAEVVSISAAAAQDGPAQRDEAASVARERGVESFELPETGVDLRATLQQLEARLIRQAILATSGNRNQAARLLGLNRTTLVEKLRKQPELAVA